MDEGEQGVNGVDSSIERKIITFFRTNENISVVQREFKLFITIKWTGLRNIYSRWWQQLQQLQYCVPWIVENIFQLRRDSFFPFLQKSHDALSTPTKVSSKSGLISRVLVIRKLGANTFASDCIGDCTQGRAAIRYVDVEVGVGGERISSY